MKTIGAKQLQRTLGTSYKAASYMSHRIRDATGDGDQPLLNGIVEVDETSIGGKRRHVGRGYPGTRQSSPAQSSAAAKSG